MNVSAVIVTRGNVDLTPVLESLPSEWEQVVWDNSVEQDLSVYGRYEAALTRASHDRIYFQDDDCVLAPESFDALLANNMNCTHVALTANMPERFRYDFYEHHCLVGFGCITPRILIEMAFAKWERAGYYDSDPGWMGRVCDVIFTGLTLPECRRLVDVPYEDLPWATAMDRMYRSTAHVGERMKAALRCREILERAA